jgi:phosphosulfolactate synthase
MRDDSSENVSESEMNQPAFSMIKIPAERSMTKPRRTGRTMMIDWGIPLQQLGGLLELSGNFIDFAKIAVGSVRVYREAQLRKKIELYKTHGIRPFIGGGITERLFALEGPSALPPFFLEARRIGIEVVEISDNYISLDRDERFRQIDVARQAGLDVLGEIGSKHQRSTAESLIAQANDCLAAGAEMVIVEGYELVEQGKPKSDIIAGLRTGLDLGRVLFELPGPWISGINASEVYDLKKCLIREFGPDVSLGNVMPEDVFETEMSRQGMGVVQPTRVTWQS